MSINLLKTDYLEKLSELLLDNVSDAIISTDQNFIIQTWNRAAEKIYGLSFYEVRGKATSDVVRYEFINDSIELSRKRLIEQGEWKGVVMFTRVDGKKVFLNASVTKLRNETDETIGFVAVNRDITEAYQMKDLLENEQRLSFALQGAGDGVWEYNFQTREVYYSAAYKKMLGFTEDEFLNDPQEWRGRIHPDDMRLVTEVEKEYDENRIQSHSLEYRILHKLNKYIWVLDRGMLIEKTAEGKPLKLIGTQTNIDYQKRAEGKIKSLLESAPDAMIITNTRGVVEIINTQAERLFGYSREEMIGQPIEFLMPGRFAENHQSHRNLFSTNPEARLMGKGFELFAKKKNGVEIPVEISLSPIDSEEGLMVAAAIRDISERKKAEQQLKESEEKFNKAFHSSPAGITLTSMATGKWVDVNESFLKMTGYQKEEVIGHTSSELQMIDSDTRNKIVEEVNNEGVIKNRELFFRKKSGETGAALFSIEQIVINREPYFIAILSDVTERKKTEQQLLKAQQLLQSFMMNTPTLNWIIDEKNCFRFWNDSYRKAFDLSPRQIGRSIYEIFPAHICDQFIENNWRVWNSGSALETVEEGVGPDGVKQVYQIFKFPLPDEDGLRLLGGVALDITSDITNQQQLRLSNERYDYVNKATSDAIWDWDIHADTIYRGEGFKTLFGYTEISSTTQFKLDQIHPADRERISSALKRSLQGNGERWQDEYSFLCSDGTYKTILDKGFIIRDEEGKAIRMIGAMQDITEQRRLQDQLVKEEERKKKEVLQAIIHAQERERHEISHELHDNVSQILTTCKLLLEASAQYGDNKYLHQTKDNLQKAIDEMRSISHRLNPATLKYIGLEGSITDLLNKINNTGTIHISFACSLNSFDKINDEIQLALFRIIQEQLNNILKHAQAKNVIIELSKENDKIRLTISDDGRGYDLNAKKHGLGLRNIFNRAEFHKGTAQIFTEPGKGFKLQVQIPQSEK